MIYLLGTFVTGLFCLGAVLTISGIRDDKPENYGSGFLCFAVITFFLALGIGVANPNRRADDLDIIREIAIKEGLAAQQIDGLTRALGKKWGIDSAESK